VELAQSKIGGYFFEAGLILIVVVKVLDRLLDAQVIIGELGIGGRGCVHRNLLSFITPILWAVMPAGHPILAGFR
jgi:hypothetical protein